MQFNIIFENEHVAAVSKPAGYLSVPSRLGSEDPRPCLGKSLEKTLKCRLWPVHRLDFEVSGLILFAKSAAAHRIANRWFEEHHVQKTYEAWTPVPEPLPELNRPQTWESTLVKGKKRAFEADHGKSATTQATLIAIRPFKKTEIAVWQLNPLTGRSHQLRYELFKRKIPVVGDGLYGSVIDFAENAIALRSIVLDFKDCGNKSSLDLPEQLLDQSISC